jgi:ribulose-5-phosphate 4-epimerase/fuculose-1-phosphate aldolase
VFRITDQQGYQATERWTRNLAEQARLEALITTVKPPLPVDWPEADAGRPLPEHQLLLTPFRYPPLVNGSRFSAADTRELFYAARSLATVLAERAFHALRLLEGSPLPEGRCIHRQQTSFSVQIHTELHRRRPEARVVVHNHPYYVVLLAALGLVPEFLHQQSSMFDGELGFVSEYSGEIDSPELGADLAERIGDASVVILANHGAIVTAPTIEEATYKSATLDRQCKLMYDVLVADRPATTVPPMVRPAMKASLLERGTEVYWAGAVRRLIREEPDVLE